MPAKASFAIAKTPEAIDTAVDHSSRRSLIIVVAVMVTVSAIGTPFRLERGPHPYKIRAQGKEHILNHMVRPNAKDIASNFSGQMTISQMPSEPRKLIGFFVPDLDNRLSSRLNLQQSPILKLQTVSISHRNRFWKVEKNFLTLIRDQANPTAVTCIKIESDRAGRLLSRPMPGAMPYWGLVHRHVSHQYMK